MQRMKRTVVKLKSGNPPASTFNRYLQVAELFFGRARFSTLAWAHLRIG
jgi:hypothetical protein